MWKISHRSVLLALMAWICANSVSQTVTENYVKSETVISASGAKVTTVQYCDGLGRPILSATNGLGKDGKYVYERQQYDYGDRVSERSIRAYGSTLPVYNANLSWLYADEYRATGYEYDALDRVTAEKGPGNQWHSESRFRRTAYLLNDAGEVRLFCVAGNALQQNNNTTYAAGTLSVELATDEDGNVTRIYRDMQGRLILERRINSANSANYDTYYVYDYLGNLRYVLPPLAVDGLGSSGSWTMATTALKKYAYYYEYDSRARCTKKQLPGCDYVTMSYDTSDRLISSQDGNQRDASPEISTYYEYDNLGRQTVMGTETAAGVKTPLLETFYDDYTFISSLSSADQTKMGFNATAGYHTTYAGAKGLQTGTRVHLLNTPTVSYVTAIYYDQLGNMIQSRSINNMGGTDVEYTQYNEFTGKPLNRRHVHSASGKPDQTETYSYTYDYADRLLNVKHRLNSNAQVTLCAYTYDEVGRVKTRRLTNNAETVSYDYNIRDWQTKIESTRFKEWIAYNETSGDVTPTSQYYGGNIGAMAWNTGNETKTRGYQFQYNPLGWLTRAQYAENGSSSNRYDTRYWYNKMGNVTAIQRKGLHDGGSYDNTDDLEFTYNGNQVTRVDDNEVDPTYSGAFNFSDGAYTSNEYTYDKNGNMTKDLNKKISSIEYNLLNLPRQITYQSGNRATYTYDATGRKLSIAYNIGGSGYTYSYCGNYVYRNGTLEKILVDGGYITLSGTTPTYHYYLQDHLGNNRVVCNASSTIEQVNHYYPFGGLFGESTNGGTQVYKYNGKELDRINGLDWYDYGARHMSPDVARFTTIDPMAEKYYNTSPYAYCGNNPLTRIDQDGRIWDTILDVGFLIYDVADAYSQYAQNGSVDASTKVAIIADASAIIIPGLTGTGLAVRSGEKVASKSVDVAKGLKNGPAIAEGRAFEKTELAASKARGENVASQVRLVPMNGKGNIKGNRSNVDQLIKKEDRHYKIVETKLREGTSKLSTGQRTVERHVKFGNKQFEVRTDNSTLGLKKGQIIEIDEYKIKYKYKKQNE